MTVSWRGFIAKSREPQPPLALRPIAVLSATYRLYATTRQRTITPWFAKHMPECVYSYLPQRDARDAGLAIATEIESAKLNIARGEKVGVYIASLDASKAFPSVDRLQLWMTLGALGMPQWVINTIEHAYQHGCTDHRLDGKYVSGRPHQLLRGIFQGCPVSTTAFVSVQLPLIRLLRQRHPSVKPIVYADDLTLIALEQAEPEAAVATTLAYY